MKDLKKKGNVLTFTGGVSPESISARDALRYVLSLLDSPAIKDVEIDSMVDFLKGWFDCHPNKESLEMRITRIETYIKDLESQKRRAMSILGEF